ncbi:hypothetical protein [Nocardiopsis changdeensis]|uniref:hypothetical protein n=1 Tax=Nocardiopsis changdeensis TaxID=2831969 RepID=UPI003F47DFC7
MTIELMFLLLLNVVTMTEFQQTPHSPERGEKRTGIFNFDKLSPEEMAEIGTGLAYVGNHEDASDPDKPLLNVEKLFVDDFEDLVDREQGKAEDVYLLLKEKGTDEALTMAALLTPAIAKNNYELARDVLTYVYHHKNSIDAAQAAVSISLKLEEELPPEQAADLDARMR